MKNMNKKNSFTATTLLVAALLVILCWIAMHLLTEVYDIIIILMMSVFVVLIFMLYRSLKTTIRSLETAKNEADTRTRIIVNSTPRICVLLDSDFNIMDCNPTATTFMGFKTKEETLAGFIKRLGEATLNYQSDKYSYMLFTEWAGVAADKGHVTYEHELSINGKYHILNVELKKVPYEENSFAIVGYAHDITEDRERERELAHANELNKLQLTKLNLMVKGSNIGLWDMTVVQGDPINPANTIAFSNEFRKLLGYETESEFPNVIDSLNHVIHPEDIPKVQQAIIAHLADKTGMTPYDIEYQIKHKDGEYRYFSAKGETIRDDDGNPVRAAGSLIDITETKNLIQEATRQRAEAEAANKAKSSFLSTMSHEIRTPMNAILGIAEIQLLNEELTSDVREAIEKIYTSGNLLLGIINNILDLSKIEAGKLELITAQYSTASLISDSAQLNVMQIGSKLIEFVLHIDAGLPAYLTGDVLRVKQILNNLLSNAFKYTAKGTVSLSVGIEYNDETGDDVMLVLKISDTGQGMTREQVDKLFNEFARFNMETNRSIEGTGLGMSITQNLIKLMDGNINIESEPGKGSEFTVRLPQTKADDEVLSDDVIENLKLFRVRSRAQKHAHFAFEPMPYGNVLIVDDMDTNIYVAMGLMAPYKFRTDSAVSGFEAIDKIKAGNKYDIIFMDHMMPKMDGIETVRIIRELGYSEPIVALTANAVLGNAGLFLDNGFDGFISKPIDIRQLNTILKKYIRDKQPPEVLASIGDSVCDAPQNTVKLIPSDTQIPGLDITRGLARYDGNESIYINILRTYTASLRSILAECETTDEAGLHEYKVRVHGIKGASLNIYAEPLADIALALEKAAGTGGLEYVSQNNPAFLEMGYELASQIDELLQLIDAENPKPQRDKPDDEVLEKLVRACELYDIDEVDAAIEELERFRYSSDDGLMDWLKERLALMQYSEIIERLKGVALVL